MHYLFIENSGNKLTYLNGQILVGLPKLHALQLAGAQNKWRCDCRLRKLVRFLLYNSGARNAPGQTILQDEPRCHWGREPGWSANDAGDGAQSDPSWTAAGHSSGTLLEGESIRSGDSIVKAGRQEEHGQEKEAGEEEPGKNGATKAAKVTRSSGTETGSEATTNERTTIRHSPLNTRHRRAPRNSADDDEDDHQDRHGRLWTSMSKYPTLKELTGALPPILCLFSLAAWITTTERSSPS